MATTGTGPTFPQGTGANASRSSSDPSDRTAAADGSGIAQTLRDSTFRKLDDQKVRASDTLGSLAGAVRGMTQPLRDGGQSGIADYVNKAADGIEQWASTMRQQDIDDAMRSVQEFARRQPALFLGVAFSAGLVLTRFLKSTPASRGYRGSEHGSRSFGAADYSRTSGSGTSLGGSNLGSTQFGTTAGDIRGVSDWPAAGTVRGEGEAL